MNKKEKTSLVIYIYKKGRCEKKRTGKKYWQKDEEASGRNT